jgi:nitrogenase iron protein NifH
LSVLHVGCDPKADSSRLLLGGRRPVSVMGTALATDLYDAGSVLMRGVAGITCVEAGGPEPGVGCAGRGITRTFELLEELGVELADYDAVVYDVLGDVVCGGFATPMKAGHARDVLVVASGTGMSLFAANNIFKAVRRFERNGVRLAGLVGNHHLGDSGRERLAAFAAATGARLLAELDHDPAIQAAETLGQSICQHRPAGASAAAIRGLARGLLQPQPAPRPRPLDEAAFEELLSAWP